MASGEAANLNKLLNQVPFTAAVSIQQAFRKVLAQGTAESIDVFVKAMGKSLNNIKYGRSTFEAANYRLARMMQESMLHAYDQSVTAQKEFPSYRAGGEGNTSPRFSGGKLRRVLEQRAMVVASPQGIAYINNDLLDSQAAQWARLNYGAGSRSGRPAGAYPWTFQGQLLGTLTLPWAPSPRFEIPPGVWVGGRGGGGERSGLTPGFYPIKALPKTPTQGIAPRRFFDAGLARYAQEFPTVYEGVLDTFIGQGRIGQGPLPAVKVYADALYFLRAI